MNRHRSIEEEKFLVTWTGFIEPRYSETYTFYISSDDKVRLWIDEKKILITGLPIRQVKIQVK